jgi:vacuolar-type H+-ATPase subunit E/Vma4
MRRWASAWVKVSDSMKTASPSGPELLRREILADARRERDELLRRAQQEAEAILAKARLEAEKLRQERLDQARAEAGRRSDLMLATVPVEAGLMRSARIESLLQSVCDEARKRLLAREGYAYREAVVALAAEAVGRMAGEDFVAKLSPADCRAFGKALCTAVTQSVGRTLTITLSEEPEITAGGVIVADAAGRQVWDNRLAVRLERLWPELRRQIALQASLATMSDQTGGGR